MLAVVLTVQWVPVFGGNPDFEWSGPCSHERFRFPHKFPDKGDPQYYNGITINRTCFANKSYDRHLAAKLSLRVQRIAARLFIGQSCLYHWRLGRSHTQRRSNCVETVGFLLKVDQCFCEV